MSQQPQIHHLTPTEKRAATSLSGIFFVRMLGLFMVMPVLSLYVEDLPGATPMLVGLAMGIHGLTQGLLQIPFGIASDRLGRKRVIVFGLLLFCAGSVLAAVADDIHGIILGRALQGGGAIASALMALTADLTREEHRMKAMAMMGMSIGMAFMAALVVGPMVDHWIGLSGIFWFTAAMALVALAILLLVVPTPVSSCLHRDAQPVPAQFLQVLRDTQLLRLDLGIFLLHLITTASFISFPLVFREVVGLPSGHHWWIYLPVLVVSVGLMVPFIIIAEKHRRMKAVYLGAIAVLGASQLMMAELYHHTWILILLMVVFFAGFNLLEASLPSLVAKFSPPESKGTAMGFYSSSQYLGIFTGGALGGVLLHHFGYQGVFVLGGVAALVWLLAAAGMKSPRYLSSYLLHVGVLDEEQARHLTLRLVQVPGVAEAVVIPGDESAYLKVDSKALDEERLLALVDGEG